MSQKDTIKELVEKHCNHCDFNSDPRGCLSDCQLKKAHEVEERAKLIEQLEDFYIRYTVADACIDCPFANKDVIYCKTCPYDN